MRRAAGVGASVAACLLLGGCESRAEQVCVAARSQAEHRDGHQVATVTVIAALVVTGYLVFGRRGALPGPGHAARMLATLGTSAVIALLFGVLGYIGGGVYADHTHPCPDSIHLQGLGAIIVLFVIAPLVALLGLAFGAVLIARSVYAGARWALASAVIGGSGVGVVVIETLHGRGSAGGWAVLTVDAAVVVPSAYLLLARIVPAAGLDPRRRSAGIPPAASLS